MVLDNPGGKLGVSVLAGLAFGLSATQRAQERLFSDLPAPIRRYEMAAQDLSAERAEELRQFVGEVVVALRATSN